MGIGAALIMPATLSLLTNIFTDPTERGRAIGVWAAVAGAGGALGPVIGGFLLEHFWWGSVFLINVPVIIVAFVAGRMLLPDVAATPMPPGSTRSGAVALDRRPGGRAVGDHRGADQGLDHARPCWRPSAIGVARARRLRRSGSCALDHPMLDVRFFKNRRFTAANAAITMVFFAMFGSMFLIDPVPADRARLHRRSRRACACCPWPS